MRQLGRQDCDDTYITNQDETIEDERTTHYKAMADRPKLEVRTIEDTFITNVDEIVEREDTTYLKSHGHNRHYAVDDRYDADERHHQIDYDASERRHRDS